MIIISQQLIELAKTLISSVTVPQKTITYLWERFFKDHINQNFYICLSLKQTFDLLQIDLPDNYNGGDGIYVLTDHNTTDYFDGFTIVYKEDEVNDINSIKKIYGEKNSYTDYWLKLKFEGASGLGGLQGVTIQKYKYRIPNQMILKSTLLHELIHSKKDLMQISFNQKNYDPDLQKNTRLKKYYLSPMQFDSYIGDLSVLIYKYLKCASISNNELTNIEFDGKTFNSYEDFIIYVQQFSILRGDVLKLYRQNKPKKYKEMINQIKKYIIEKLKRKEKYQKLINQIKNNQIFQINSENIFEICKLLINESIQCNEIDLQKVLQVLVKNKLYHWLELMFEKKFFTYDEIEKEIKKSWTEQELNNFKKSINYNNN